MAEMYYTSQPLETDNLKALELTFEMTRAKTQLLYASDWPHWDFDPPAVIWDIPFLDDEARKNILGLTPGASSTWRSSARGGLMFHFNWSRL